MNPSELATRIDLQIAPGERWTVLGPGADAFRAILPPAESGTSIEPGLDGVLLAEAISAQPNPLDWLADIIKPMKEDANLIVVDWQYDGPTHFGPELDQRLRRGYLCRWLRNSEFGVVQTLANHAAFYVVKAVKGPAPPQPHAGEFIVVATRAELPKNRMKKVELFGQSLIVANTGREFVAFGQVCPHAGQPLEQGLLRGNNIVCRAHNYIWNVRTGAPVEPPDEDILPKYPVRVDSNTGEILVALAPPDEPIDPETAE